MELRELLNRIFYFLKSSGGWRMLPHDLHSWGTVHYYYRQWRRAGIWRQVHDHLRDQVRREAGREVSPSAGVMDSQSVKTTKKGGREATTNGARAHAQETGPRGGRGCEWAGSLGGEPARALPLIISDWMMPDLDGLALTRMVRDRQSSYSYVLLLTALGGKASYLEGIDAGVDDFITKPFDAEQLAARIRVAERILGLLSEVKSLAGMLPIYSYCKKIRDDQNYWQQVEVYVMQRSEAKFSHGICPHCYEEQVLPQLEQAQREAERRHEG